MQVVNDQIGSPTYACHLAALCIELVTAANFAERFAKTRLLHCAGQGQASWYQLAQEIVSLTGSDIAVAAVSSNQWPALAKRPVYSGLSSEKLTQQLGLSMPPWQHSLAICLQKMGQSE